MSDLHLASKVRLYPTPEQEVLLRKTIGCCRFIYNGYLAQRLKEYDRYKTEGCPKNFRWKKVKTESQLKETYEWLKEVDATALQQSRIDLHRAFTNYHKHGFGRPKFHKKGHKESFRVQMGNKIETNEIKIGKCGWLKFRGQVRFKGRIKNVTVSLDAGKWYASILTVVDEDQYYQPVQHEHSVCGIDLGVVKPLTITDGKRFAVWGLRTKERLEQLEHRRKRYQRQISRKVKGSNNRFKYRKRLQRAFQRERNVRKEFVEQTSHRLTSEFETILFEDLNVKGMTKKGKHKRGLNREMLRLGLGTLIARCQQKANQRGSFVKLVDPRYTSQTCSDCGTIDKRSRESQSRFRCVSCGFTLNADKNAALNILAKH